MEGEKIIGKIEQYHKSEGKPVGIKVNGVWYNATDKTEQFVQKFKDKKGVTVEIKHSKNKILFIKETEGGSSSPVEENKEDKIIRQACIKASAKAFAGMDVPPRSKTILIITAAAVMAHWCNTGKVPDADSLSDDLPDTQEEQVG